MNDLMVINEVIKVNCERDIQTTSARSLWEFLGRPYRDFNPWFDKYKEYGFTENEDYRALTIKIVGGQGNEVDAQDYEITIDMAKELAMLQKSDKGKIARQYFLELEKQWNSPEALMARALKFADSKIIQLQQKNETLQLENAKQNQIIHELRPKASYYDFILQTKAAISVNQIAKDYGMSAMKLNSLLHDLKVQYKQGDTWLLYQDHAPMGYTSSKTHNYTDTKGDQCSRLHTYWTQKGRLFIYELLKQNEILPLIERNELRLVQGE